MSARRDSIYESSILNGECTTRNSLMPRGFTAISTIIIICVPESPRWLLRKGRREAAAKALRRFNGSVPGYDVERELDVMAYELTGEVDKAAEDAKASYIDIFKGPNLRRTLVSTSILSWQQCLVSPRSSFKLTIRVSPSSTATLRFCSVKLVFRIRSCRSHVTRSSLTFSGTLITSLISLSMITCSSYLVERLGRRPLLVGAGCVMVLMLAVIGGLGFLPLGPTAGGATIGIMCVWVVAYALSAGPCGYLLLGESSTLRLRAKTTGFAAALSGIFGLIFNYATPLMILPTGGGAGWGLKTSFFFAGTAFIGLVLVYFFVPEHKGRSYAELDELYGNKVPARKFKSTITEAQRARMGETA